MNIAENEAQHYLNLGHMVLFLAMHEPWGSPIMIIVSKKS